MRACRRVTDLSQDVCQQEDACTQVRWLARMCSCIVRGLRLGLSSRAGCPPTSCHQPRLPGGSWQAPTSGQEPAASQPAETAVPHRSRQRRTSAAKDDRSVGAGWRAQRVPRPAVIGCAPAAACTSPLHVFRLCCLVLLLQASGACPCHSQWQPSWAARSGWQQLCRDTQGGPPPPAKDVSGDLKAEGGRGSRALFHNPILCLDCSGRDRSITVHAAF